jgi:hypothetical protein
MSPEHVTGLLFAAGLVMNERELAGQVRAYAGLRAAVDALYDVPAVRYADPVLIFPAFSGTAHEWAADQVV